MNDQPLSWWVRNRDRLLLGGTAVMFFMLVQTVPKEQAAMRDEHKALLNAVQIQCVHDAKNDRERRECLTLKLEP